MWEYNIIHNEQFDARKNKVLLNALLRLPETNSRQSEKNTIFINSAYDTFFIDLLKSLLNLSATDIEISGDLNIINNIAKHYEDEICLNCSKVVLKKGNDKTDIVCFFRHLRNIIAHGHFNILCDYFIGFDIDKGKYTAAIKVKYDNLKKVITYFIDSSEIYDIYRKCLKKIGYRVADNGDEFIYAKKNNRAYALIIKHYKGRYASKKDIKDFIKEYNHIDKTDCMFVLIIDSTYVTKNIQVYLANYNIAVFDKSMIKRMMQGEDVLKELLDK